MDDGPRRGRGRRRLAGAVTVLAVAAWRRELARGRGRRRSESHLVAALRSAASLLAASDAHCSLTMKVYFASVLETRFISSWMWSSMRRNGLSYRSQSCMRLVFSTLTSPACVGSCTRVASSARPSATSEKVLASAKETLLSGAVAGAWRVCARITRRCRPWRSLILSSEVGTILCSERRVWRHEGWRAQRG